MTLLHGISRAFQPPWEWGAYSHGLKADSHGFFEKNKMLLKAEHTDLSLWLQLARLGQTELGSSSGGAYGAASATPHLWRFKVGGGRRGKGPSSYRKWFRVSPHWTE